MILMISRMVARLVTTTLVVYWILLLLGTHLPAPAVGDLRVSDKLLHFSAYAGLAFLLACTVSAYRRPHWSTYWWLAAIVLLYGAFDELSQLPIPGRNADILDWMADAAGTAVGLSLQRFALAVYEQLSTRPNHSPML
ncbi:MAG: VanZ family protein [Planctomycetes bacterium]|nr:VanZ family protein [Planctomycetota bacterium]